MTSKRDSGSHFAIVVALMDPRLQYLLDDLMAVLTPVKEMCSHAEKELARLASAEHLKKVQNQVLPHMAAIPGQRLVHRFSRVP